MADTFKFPNGGYDVTVLRKQDILDCIDKNIIDKDLAFSIVEQCEMDAADFISKGRWTGLPFIGNVRMSRMKVLEKDPVQQALIEEAKENLTHQQYIVFRRQLTKENAKLIKNTRYYNYITSMAVTKNKLLYKKLCATKGEVYARIFLYASSHVTATDNEYVNLEEDGE